MAHQYRKVPATTAPISAGRALTRGADARSSSLMREGSPRNPSHRTENAMIAALPLLFLQLANTPPQEMDTLRRRLTPEVRVVQEVAPSIVHITTEGPQQTFRNIFGQVYQNRATGSGSGVVIDEEGYIVTNYHVVKHAENGKIRVYFDPTFQTEQEFYEAQLISAEPQEDLALLKIDGDEPFSPVRLGRSSDLMIAERVLAIGSPYGQTHTVSQGIISGLHRDVRVNDRGTELSFEDLIQTDAAINPGNSGGALVNINGELIGINTVMNTQAENIGFAIPVDRVRRVLQDRLLSPSLARAWLGFDVDLETLAVERVLPGSPAALADVKVGDRVVRIDDKEITDANAYRFARLEIRPYHSVRIGLERGSEDIQVELDSWDRIRGLLFARMGLEVEELKITVGWFTQSRLRAVSVREGGPADGLGMQEGDIIESLTLAGGRYYQPRNPADLAILVNRLEPGEKLELDLWRDLDGDQRFERDAGYSELFQGPLELD